MRKILPGTAALLLCLIPPATGLALNLDIGKIIDIGSKAIQATASVPVEREVEIGRGMAASLLGAAPLLQDEKVERYVNRVGKWLASRAERPELTWHFGILNVDTVNAFAAPGGYVFVTRGLMRAARSEAELAGVLAHEIGHVIRRHHLEAIRKEAMRGIAVDLATEALNQQGFNASPFIKAGMQLYARGLDREDEYDADRVGVVLATRGGYEPYGLPRVLLTLNAMNPSDANLQLLSSTHPPLSERLLRLDQIMQGKFDSYAAQPQVSERFAEYVHGAAPAAALPPDTAATTGKLQAAQSVQPSVHTNTAESALSAPAPATTPSMASAKSSEPVTVAAAEPAAIPAAHPPALEIGQSCSFTLQYRDKGSGGESDVSIYDPKLAAGFRSIGSYGQGNYDNPQGCVTVVKPLVSALPNGMAPLIDPAGYELVWTDHKSGADMDGSVWQPLAPNNNYICIGSVAQTGYNQPSLPGYACVHKCLVQNHSGAAPPLWTDAGTGAAKQVSIYQLPTSKAIVALPGRARPSAMFELNPAGMCQ